MELKVDPRIAQAKQKGMAWCMDRLRLSGLKRAGAVEHVGPCPVHGGSDTFGVNTRKEMFICRKGSDAGDPIRLVQHVLGLDFEGALMWMCGARQEISAEEQQKRDKAAEDNKDRKDAEAAEFRKRATQEARKIWRDGRSAKDSPVRDYLARRGITRTLLPDLPRCLRFAPDLPYMVAGKPGEWLCAHRGPAMLAVIQGPDVQGPDGAWRVGEGTGVHRTWFDLAAPQGKVSILHPLTGEKESRKKSWGSKKGGAIRLIHGSGDTLVMGEGIETTLTAAIAGVWPAAHFWAGIDLGNMSGRRESGKGLKYAGLPDLGDDEAFVPPPWVRTLIYVQDGDSDRRNTRAMLEAGLRRAMIRRPGLRGQIAPCPDGKDLNDVLLEGAT